MVSENKKKNQKENNRTKRYRQLNKLQKSLKLKFKDKSLLNRALTHRSYVNEYRTGLKDNERLEYLGDEKFQYSYMRHTGQWWPTAKMTIDDCLKYVATEIPF